MRVLIIGGTGFLSSALVAQSVAEGHQVTVLTRGRSARPVPEGIEALTANRSEPGLLREALQERSFDLVLDAILYRPDDARAAVEIFRGRVARYVFISTDFVYGGEPRIFPLSEDAPRRALSRYGRDKAACEDIFFDAWERERFPVTILRPPHILGAGGHLGTGSREGRDPWLLWRLRGAHAVCLLEGGALLIPPVHRDDIARACFAVAQSEKALGRAYNIAGPDCVTTKRYYELVAEIAGAPPPTMLSLPAAAFVAAFPDQAPFTQNRAYALDRLQADTGFAPTVRLPDALAEMVADLDARGLPQGPPPETETPLVTLLRAQAEAVTEALRGA